MLSYLLMILLLLILVGLVYANRKQARVTAVFGAPEPEIDLSYTPAPSEQSHNNLREVLEKPRDPGLEKLSDKELVLEVLKECYDPEIPLNIVDLGLIYDVEVGKESTKVKMSLTAPGCPSGQEITQDIRGKLEEAGFPNPQVELVWEPQWTAQRISEEGRKILGI